MKSLTIRDILPILSQSVRDVNPQLSCAKSKKTIPRPSVGSGNGKHGVMNKTEAEFAFLLESAKRRDEILRYEFEGITLRWADMRYTPDFIVFMDNENDYISTKSGRIREQTIKLIEVKGGHIWDRDIVRFKGARAYWPEFTFEMWQKVKLKDCTPVTSSWKRKY